MGVASGYNFMIDLKVLKKIDIVHPPLVVKTERDGEGLNLLVTKRRLHIEHVLDTLQLFHTGI